MNVLELRHVTETRYVQTLMEAISAFVWQASWEMVSVVMVRFFSLKLKKNYITACLFFTTDDLSMKARKGSFGTLKICFQT